MNGLDAGRDVMLCQPGDVGRIDDLDMFQAVGNRQLTRHTCYFLKDIQHFTIRPISDGMNAGSDASLRSRPDLMSHLFRRCHRDTCLAALVTTGLGVRRQHPCGLATHGTIRK